MRLCHSVEDPEVSLPYLCCVFFFFFFPSLTLAVCLGLHLAIRELRLGASHFFRAFPQAKMSSLEKMDDSDMDQMCYFIMSPKRKRCLMEAP